MTTEVDIIEAASDLAALLEAESIPKHQAARDKAIRGALRKVTRLARSRFRAQRKAVLDSHALANLHATLTTAGHTQESLREDRGPGQPLEDDITALLATHIYTVPVTANEQAAFARAITTAIDSGAEASADMLTVAFPKTESFVSEYLKDGGFSRLTGDLDKTTVDQLASAVADAYESGADFDGIVQAVKDSFAQASDVRAKMIAQTELNDAYNQGVMHFGKEAGATQKSWILDLAPCLICIANAADGQVDIDEDFESGDDAPPAHPNCFCSLLVSA